MIYLQLLLAVSIISIVILLIIKFSLKGKYMDITQLAITMVKNNPK